MQPVRRSPAQILNDTSRVAIRLQPVQVVEDQNEIFTQRTAQPQAYGRY
jgi:hypothetical protein